MRMFLAGVVMAVLVATSHAESLSEDWQQTELPVAHRQRALLATAGTAAFYSPSYSPSPASSPAVSSPSPKPASPMASPSPVPASPVRASPKPASPKVCKFARTKNANTYKIVIRATGSWGLGAKALTAAAARVYKKYSQTKLKIQVTGPKGQFPKKPYQSFVYFADVPVTPCTGFKEGLRASLATALKRVKYSKSIKVARFSKVR